jgi:hypothetical protein
MLPVLLKQYDSKHAIYRFKFKIDSQPLLSITFKLTDDCSDIIDGTLNKYGNDVMVSSYTHIVIGLSHI